MTILSWIKSHKYLLISFIINIILCICLMSNCQGRESKVNIEYVPVHDTITLVEDRIVEHTKQLFISDTLLKVDTVYVEKDGTYVELPMKWSQYTDTIKTDSSETKVDITYHGIEAGIDKIVLDNKYNREIHTVIQPPKKWSIGIQAGVGGQYGIVNRQFDVGPYIGVGINYNFYIK